MDNVKRIYDLCKTLKGNTINIYNNRIMALNSAISPISSISVIYTDTQLGIPDTQCISMEKLKNYYMEGNYEENYIPTSSIAGIKESIILDSFKEPKDDEVEFYIENLRDIEDFNIAMSKKAKYGLSLIYVDEYPISISSGLLPVNKSDNISLAIFKDGIPNSFLAKFIIDKKKFVIYKYIRYIYI